MFEEETEEKTDQYMNEHAENYNCENTKLETDNYNAGLERGYEDGFKDGITYGYNKANEWHDLRKDPNDLPKDDKYVIVTDGKLWTSAYYDKAWMIHTTAFSKKNLRYLTIVGLHKIIKWKEVIIEEN